MSLKRNALHMLGGQLSVALFQGLQFLLIARALGPSEFGKMAGVLAITSALLPFSGLGAGNVMVMRLARQEGAAALYLGNALLVATFSGLALIGLAAWGGPWFLRNPDALSLILIFGVSEILVTKFIDIACHAFYGLEQHAIASQFMFVQSVARFVVAGAYYLLVPQASAATWAWLHLLAGLIALLIVSIMTVRRVGRPQIQPVLAMRELKVGVFFSIGLSAKSIYTDVDKAVLSRYAAHSDSGAYTAAFRLIYMAFTPIMSVLLASQVKFFKAGGSQQGLSATTRFATKLAGYGLVYCLLFAVAVYFCAPLVEWALGPAYRLSAEVLKSLALLPLALMLQALCSEALTGANYQRARSIAQVLAASLCVALNFSLVPSMGWHGAVISTYVSQLALALMAGGTIWFLLRRSPR
ncbi:MAG: oligosaccharide flippase family protein [Pseudomonadota bacterium]